MSINNWVHLLAAKTFRYIALSSVTLVLTMLLSPSAISLDDRAFNANSQEVSINLPSIEATRSVLFPETKRSGRAGDLAYASVQLDGRNLFDVATVRSIADEPENQGEGPLDVRIQRIENRVQTFLHERLISQDDIDTLSVNVASLNNQVVVQAITAKMDDPVTLVTVTDNDVEIYGITATEVGDHYAEGLYNGLARAYRERETGYVQKVIGWAVVFAIATCLISFLLVRLSQRNWQKQRQLRDQLRQLPAHLSASDSTKSSEEEEQADAIQDSKRHLKQQLNWQKIRLQGLVLAQGLLWLMTISFILRLFPQTRSLGLLSFNRPVEVAVTWLAIILTRQANLFLTNRLLMFSLKYSDGDSPETQERLQKRLPTLFDTLKNLVNDLLLVLGVVLTIQILFGLSGLQLFASAGVLGLAASFVFQSSLQDMVSGAMFLWHDAYAVGDIVSMGDNVGQVEGLTLLMTQLRSPDGEVISLRNGTINSVKNLTKEWARINLFFDVALDTEIDKALYLMKQVFEEMTQEVGWRESILDEPDILAVDRIAHSGITLNIRAKTAPMHQWSVSREYQRRLKQAFARAEIQIGAPQQTIKIQNSSWLEKS